MAIEVWLILPVLLVMLVSGSLAFHPRFRDSRRAKLVNLVVAAVCFAAVVALVISLVARLEVSGMPIGLFDLGAR